MKTNTLPLPERGYRKKIAEIVGCCEKTVTLALRTRTRGYKCDEVREVYNRLYVKPYLKKAK